MTFFIVATTAPIITVLLVGSITKNISKAIRMSIFQIVSSVTTTGLRTTSDLSTWPPATLFLLIVLMLIGGSAGTAAGGIKQARLIVLFKSIWRDLQNKLNPRRIIRDSAIHHFGIRDTIADEDIAQTESYILLYLAIFTVGSLAYSLFGHSIQDSAFEFASVLGTVGFSTGITNPNASAGVLWIGIAGMILGRFEVYFVLMAMTTLIKDGAETLRGRHHGS
jgi:trk system potassium uptake protein TrkH